MADETPPPYAPQGEVEFMPDWHKLDHAARLKLIKATYRADEQATRTDPSPPTEGR